MLQFSLFALFAENTVYRLCRLQTIQSADINNDNISSLSLACQIANQAENLVPEFPLFSCSGHIGAVIVICKEQLNV